MQENCAVLARNSAFIRTGYTSLFSFTVPMSGLFITLQYLHHFGTIRTILNIIWPLNHNTVRATAERFSQIYASPVWHVFQESLSCHCRKTRKSYPTNHEVVFDLLSLGVNLGVLVFVYTVHKIGSSFKIIIHPIPFFEWYLYKGKICIEVTLFI